MCSRWSALHLHMHAHIPARHRAGKTPLKPTLAVPTASNPGSHVARSNELATPAPLFAVSVVAQHSSPGPSTYRAHTAPRSGQLLNWGMAVPCVHPQRDTAGGKKTSHASSVFPCFNATLDHVQLTKTGGWEEVGSWLETASFTCLIVLKFLWIKPGCTTPWGRSLREESELLLVGLSTPFTCREVSECNLGDTGMQRGF